MATDNSNAQTSGRSIGWGEIWTLAETMIQGGSLSGFDLKKAGVYGVPTGGSVVANVVCGVYNTLHQTAICPLGEPRDHCVVIDDLIDSGRTMRPFYDAKKYNCRAFFSKEHSPDELAGNSQVVSGYVKFPWEHSGEPEDAVVRLLQYIDENPDRPGLLDTPRRVCKSLKEMTSGTHQDPQEFLNRTFHCKSDEMVVVRGIPFWSLCEHHLMPFHGTVDVGYIPESSRVFGLSKIPRLVQCFAQRLQIQERMTTQIAEALNCHSNTPLEDSPDEPPVKLKGVGVVIRASHTCMCARGIRSAGEMVTSCLLGAMREDPSSRAEFLNLTK